MNIVFMGTPDFAIPALDAILNSGRHRVVAAYSQPPKPAGRGLDLVKSKVQQLAEAKGIPVHIPKSLKGEGEQKIFHDLNADIAVVAAYGLLLPKAILNAPKYGCINIHPSKLPRWRGAAPIQRTIMAGDRNTAICIMQMDEGLDTGDIILQKNFEVSAEDTSGSLHDKLATEGAKLLLEALDLIESGKVVRVPQVLNGITYASKIDKAETKLDFTKSAQETECIIRGLNPFPGAYFEYNDERIKIFSAEVKSLTGQPGEVLDDQLTIACAENSIRPLTIQRAGKKTMPTSEALKGLKIPKGSML